MVSKVRIIWGGSIEFVGPSVSDGILVEVNPRRWFHGIDELVVAPDHQVMSGAGVLISIVGFDAPDFRTMGVLLEGGFKRIHSGGTFRTWSNEFCRRSDGVSLSTGLRIEPVQPAIAP
jgi:hypothetical protein